MLVFKKYRQESLVSKASLIHFLSRWLLGMLMCVLLFGSDGASIGAQAAQLDHIEDYTIRITPYTDGSLEMNYHIEWEVLDSTSDGPLEWVKVGIPNEYIEDLEALSDSIDKISYYRSGGDYVRLDLDRSYYAGEIVELDFRFRQHRMYEKTSVVSWMDEPYGGWVRLYSFTPGWFEEIDISNLMIYWNSTGVFAVEGEDWSLEYDEAFLQDAYCFSASLAAGERYTVNLVYEDSTFPSEDSGGGIQYSVGKIVLFICMTVCPIALAVGVHIYYKVKKPETGVKDYYTRHSGMGSVYHRTGGSHYRSRGGGGCACACACAGGGRAGCSKKDFYGTKLETRKILRMCSSSQEQEEQS